MSLKRAKSWRYTFHVVRSEFASFHDLFSPLIAHREGDKIVLEGEADQIPGQEPGNIIFNVVEVEHSVFRRAGADLSADLEITLAEALCGFSRVIVKHLDGRGLLMNHLQPKGRIMRPGQVIKFVGEGMPHKKSELKGDLYMIVRVKFPEDGWFREGDALTTLKSLLPKPAEPIKANIVDEVEYDESASIDDFGTGTQDGEAWEDDDDEDEEGGCPQQ